MPNWCYNTLTITGDTKEVKKFKKLADGERGNEKTVLDFNKLLPYPKEFEEADKAYAEAEAKGVEYDKRPKDGFNNGGYEWCRNNWGTKWNSSNACISDEKFTKKDGYLEYTFDTAWSPPIELFTKISESFPTLEFDLTYKEEGNGFKGEAFIVCGDVSDNCVDIVCLFCPDEECGNAWDVDDGDTCPWCDKKGLDKPVY